MSTLSWNGTSSRILCKEVPRSRSHRSAKRTRACTRRPLNHRNGSKPKGLPDSMVSLFSCGRPTMKPVGPTSRGAMLFRKASPCPKATLLLRSVPTTVMHLSLSSVSSVLPTWLLWLAPETGHLETQCSMGRGERQALPCLGRPTDLPALRRVFVFMHRNG